MTSIAFNHPEASAPFDANSACAPRTAADESAIDEFYGRRDWVISNAFTTPFSEDPELRNVLALGLYSASEVYFRRILSEVFEICPIASDHGASQQIPLGAVSMFPSSSLGLAVGDGKGFSTSGEVVARTKNILGIVIHPTSSAGVALKQFDDACQLRHAIVHQGGELGFGNRRLLGLNVKGRVRVRMDDACFQSLVQRLVNAVRAYNMIVPNEVLRRWFTEGVMTRTWRRDRARFSKLLRTFASARDATLSDAAFPIYSSLRQQYRVP